MCSSTVSSNLANDGVLHQLDAVIWLVLLERLDLLGSGRGYFFPCFGHTTPSVLDGDAHAARGAFDHAHGGVEVVGVQVLHLDLGDLAHLLRGIVPAVPRPAVPLPFSMPAAFLIRSAAGGVLVTKLNERSSKTVIRAG